MKFQNKLVWIWTVVPAFLVSLVAHAQTGSRYIQDQATETGASGLWILANVSYAGMRAQDSQSHGWRALSFLFGFPGTLLSLLAIRQGSQRAYGIDIPKRDAPRDQPNLPPANG